NLWAAYQQAHEELTQSKLRDWCERHFLSFLRMREWRELHRQLRVLAGPEGRDSSSEPRTGESRSEEALHCALLSGLPTQVARRDEKGGYRGTRERRWQ
ncbi:ATP-dependent helicase HrpA, partial [mine drainage metagenome]